MKRICSLLSIFSAKQFKSWHLHSSRYLVWNITFIYWQIELTINLSPLILRIVPELTISISKYVQGDYTQTQITHLVMGKNRLRVELCRSVWHEVHTLPVKVLPVNFYFYCACNRHKSPFKSSHSETQKHILVLAWILWMWNIIKCW